MEGINGFPLKIMMNIQQSVDLSIINRSFESKLFLVKQELPPTESTFETDLFLFLGLTQHTVAEVKILFPLIMV